MPSLFLIGSPNKRELIETISKELMHLGNIVTVDYDIHTMAVEEWEERRNLSDAFIPIITEEVLADGDMVMELILLKNGAEISEKLFLPVVDTNIDFSQLPPSYKDSLVIYLDSKSKSRIRETARMISGRVLKSVTKRSEKKEEAKQIISNIEVRAPEYIDDALGKLTKRESYLRNWAQAWYGIGFLTIVSGVIVAIWFANNGLANFKDQENWSKVLFYTVKSVFIIVLLIAASKYSFNLARSYMGESLKIADRIHAISFGRFYLQVFNQKIEPDELKEIFRDWNIGNHSNFHSQNPGDYDPKIFENLASIVDKIRGAKKD